MKLIILDRDGVINHDSDEFIKSPDEWIPIPKSLDAIALLHKLQYKIAIATNQSGIGRNLFNLETLDNMHKKMISLVEKNNGKIDGIWFCPHTAKDNCLCRKPQATMIEEIIRYFKAKPEETYMVGDKLSDLEAIHRANGIPILSLTGKGKLTLTNNNLPPNTKVFNDLWNFVQYILKIETKG